jgi:acetyl-CoA synthetase
MTETPSAPFNMARYCIGQAAKLQPEKPALLIYNRPAADEPCEAWRFIDLERAVLQCAASLAALGLKRGDRVAILLGNSSRSALMFFGAIAGGFIALPVSENLTAPELAALLEDSGAAVLATASDIKGIPLPSGTRVLTAEDVDAMFWNPATGSTCRTAADYAATNAGDPAFLIYTSGTTARPKGVLHAHRSALGRRPMYQGWYGIGPEDRMLHAGAFNWTYTLGVGLTDPWANGATAIVYTGTKDPELWPHLIAKTGATMFAAVPTVYRQILKYARPSRERLGRLRHGLMAGETPPPGLYEAWEAATSLPLYEALGMSEISTYISTGPTVPRRPGTVGKAQAGRRVAILSVEGGTEPLAPGEDGLIAVHRSDPGLMLTYWNRPDEAAEVYRGDWFIGGDLGRMDADGYITHLGRANDIMNAQGYRVAPQEIEAVVAECPGVAEVACAELRVRADVSVIAAFVVKTPDAALDGDAVLRFVGTRLAGYKTPREIVFLDALPRTANGKVKRSALPGLIKAASIVT